MDPRLREDDTLSGIQFMIHYRMLLLSVMAVFFFVSSDVDAKVYKCVSSNKHIMYQDRPCDGASSSAHATKEVSSNKAKARHQDIRSMLLGEWLWEKNKDGITMTGHLSIRKNGMFVSSFSIADKPVMDSSGTWSYNNRKVVWTYKTSSIPLPFKEDIDEVLSATKNQLILKAKLDGKVYTLKRMR